MKFKVIHAIAPKVTQWSHVTVESHINFITSTANTSVIYFSTIEMNQIIITASVTVVDSFHSCKSWTLCYKVINR